MSLNITKQLLEGRPEAPAELYNGKRIIVIHNTATFGADAKTENAYFQNNWENAQSFVHAFVDWHGDVYEHAEFGYTTWGAGYVNKYAFLQVEQCLSNLDDENQKSADNVAQYVAEKMKQSGYSFDEFQLISHADASRDFGGTDHTDTIVGITWDDFLSRVKQYYHGETAVTKQPKQVEEVKPADAGTFQCSYDIKARCDGPDTTNQLAYTFKKDDCIKFDRRLLANGHEWISQPRADGIYWYIPVREINDKGYWGSF